MLILNSYCNVPNKRVWGTFINYGNFAPKCCQKPDTFVLKNKLTVVRNFFGQFTRNVNVSVVRALYILSYCNGYPLKIVVEFVEMKSLYCTA